MPAKKKTAEETAVKKTVKKAPAKKPAAPKVEKKSLQEYKDVINWKKWEAHNMGWLYIEVNAGDLNTELEAGVDNLRTCCKAILELMLEGDGFITEPKVKSKVAATLTVRYYTDNLSESRRSYWEVNQ